MLHHILLLKYNFTNKKLVEAALERGFGVIQEAGYREFQDRVLRSFVFSFVFNSSGQRHSKGIPFCKAVYL